MLITCFYRLNSPVLGWFRKKKAKAFPKINQKQSMTTSEKGCFSQLFFLGSNYNDKKKRRKHVILVNFGRKIKETSEFGVVKVYCQYQTLFPSCSAI